MSSYDDESSYSDAPLPENYRPTSSRSRQREASSATSTQISGKERFGELYSEKNKAPSQEKSTSLLCKINSDGDYVFGKAENNMKVRSALELGEDVLENLTMFARVAEQAPGQCIDLLQQLSNAGCNLAEVRLSELQGTSGKTSPKQEQTKTSVKQDDDTEEKVDDDDSGMSPNLLTSSSELSSSESEDDDDDDDDDEKKQKDKAIVSADIQKQSSGNLNASTSSGTKRAQQPSIIPQSTKKSKSSKSKTAEVDTIDRSACNKLNPLKPKTCRDRRGGRGVTFEHGRGMHQRRDTAGRGGGGCAVGRGGRGGGAAAMGMVMKPTPQQQQQMEAASAASKKKVDDMFKANESNSSAAKKRVSKTTSNTTTTDDVGQKVATSKEASKKGVEFIQALQSHGHGKFVLDLTDEKIRQFTEAAQYRRARDVHDSFDALFAFITRLRMNNGVNESNNNSVLFALIEHIGLENYPIPIGLQEAYRFLLNQGSNQEEE